MQFRQLTIKDGPWLLKLNQQCLPAVSPLDNKKMLKLLAISKLSIVAIKDEQPIGVLMGIFHNTAYESENYCWFDKHCLNFLYIDRIMVTAKMRGHGIGEMLYQETARLAKQKTVTSLTCEVNEDPPNPKSMAFHSRLGFKKIATYYNQSQNKQVAMLEKIL